MSDIVERLRERGLYGDGLEDDAADEIERLRDALQQAREYLPDEVISIEHRRETDYADHLADRIDALLNHDMRQNADSEIERLIAELLTARGEVEDMSGEIEQLREKVKLLNSFRPDAELARLRGLLEDACRWHEQFPIHRVREALDE